MLRLIVTDKVWHADTTHRTISELAALLQRHMSIEDMVMFPLFEGETETREGLTRRLRSEHLAIDAAMEHIVALAASSAPHEQLHARIEELDARLTEHLRSEEWVVFEVYERLSKVSVGA